MDTGGPSQPNPTTDAQRQAAAAIARRKVLAAYSNPVPTDNNASRLKDEPVNPKINSESWQKYHTAWQDYYQKYYSEYYANAARNYIAKERMKDIRDRAETEAVTKQTADDFAESHLKKLIRSKATDNAKKARRHRRLIPLFAGISVVLIILFLQYNRLIFAPIMAYISPGNAPASQIEAIDPTVDREISADPKLIIPKLNIEVTIRFNIAAKDVMSAMNTGVAHYRIAGASAYPGEIGNFVITGHSAGDIYSSNPYKFIFSGLERLTAGDLIYVNYQSTRYTYTVTSQKVIDPSNVAALVYPTNKPILTLVTCYPLGTSRSRLLIAAEQISPTYNADDTPATDDPAVDDGDINALPSSEPSFFEGIWNWLTGNTN